MIHCSVGIAIYPDNGENVETLMANADNAMYQAKALQEGSAIFFTEEMNIRLRERMQMEQDLNLAIELGQLALHFQPIVDTAGPRHRGAEALIRWHRPEKGLVSPADFIPLAEATGQIVGIGDWVLEQACRCWRGWHDAGLNPGFLAINVSRIQFRKRFSRRLAELMTAYRIPAHALEFEITESVLLDDHHQVAEELASLRALGVKLALDDFGTGYSSLSYLQRVPFDKIKIDRSFVTGASDLAGRNASLIRAMVGLASDLKMQTTAEGVETQDELQLVRNLGCSLVQGYFFGKPMPADEARELAAKGAVDRPSAQFPAREPRMRIIRAALLHYQGQVKGARLRNISAGGALVECREELPVGAQIKLDFAAGGMIDAEVRWTKGTQFGCQFKERFDLKLLQPPAPTTKSSKVVAPDYLKGDGTDR